MGGYAVGFQGANESGSSFDSAISSFIQEAWSGNLSDIDKQTILDNGSAAIAKASAGQDPATIAAAQAAMNADVNAALNSFSVGGDSGGAQPSNDLRLPGGLTLSPATLEWGMIGIAILIIGAVALPYIAPIAVGSIRAGRSIRGATR
jgi:hypothetical protein